MKRYLLFAAALLCCSVVSAEDHIGRYQISGPWILDTVTGKVESVEAVHTRQKLERQVEADNERARQQAKHDNEVTRQQLERLLKPGEKLVEWHYLPRQQSSNVLTVRPQPSASLEVDVRRLQLEVESLRNQLRIYRRY